MSNELQKIGRPGTGNFPSVITGTWEGARKWADGAGNAERLKLFCQVMCGIELIAIKAQAGIQQGGDRKSEEAKSKSHDGILIGAKEIEEKLGIPHSTAGRWSQMGELVLKRLKKIPALRDFDPTTTTLAALPPATVEALTSAVKKLTDSVTQREFGESLGLWKKPPGNHNPTPRRPVDPGDEDEGKDDEDFIAFENSMKLYMHESDRTLRAKDTARLAKHFELIKAYQEHVSAILEKRKKLGGK